MRARALTAVTAAFLLLGGCSKAGTTTSQGGTSRGGTMLTQEQLAATNSQNLYDAIQKLRPDWLTSRGPASVTDPTPAVASVFMNGTMLGKTEYLREMRLLDVTEIRYWDAGRASARFGMGHPRGVIEIVRR
jgi:hypothetical protein